MGRWQRTLLDADAGVYRYDTLFVLKKTQMPAVLLEAGLDREPGRGIGDGIARTAATDQRGSGGCRRQLLRGAITQARAANRATFESQTYAIGAFAPACARAYGNATPLTPLLPSNFGIH